jgi:hypothetical protein
MRFLFYISVMLFWMACSPSNSEKDPTQAYETQKESLGSIEKKNPKRFLKVDLKKKKNVVGQTVVKGTIHNNATVVTYKDVQIKLRFYSKTGTLLEEDEDTIYETVTPGGKKSFKLKYFAPKDTDSVAVSVLGAVSEE